MDIGRGGVVKLSDEETERRWQATTPQWPIMHAVLYGITRDQMMAKHMANHIQVAYAPDAATAQPRARAQGRRWRARSACSVNLCGDLEAVARAAPGGEVPRVTGPQAPCALGLDFGTASVRALVVETRDRARARLGRRGLPARRDRRGAARARARGCRRTGRCSIPGDWIAAIETAVPRGARGRGRADGGDRRHRRGLHLLHGPAGGRGGRGRSACCRAWAARPHAWVKLWKHHAAQPQADRINALAAERGEAFLADYGGKTSSEWLVAKALQVLEEDPGGLRRRRVDRRGRRLDRRRALGRARAQLLRRGLQGILEPRARIPVAGVLRGARSAVRRALPEKLGGEIVPPGPRASAA